MPQWLLTLCVLLTIMLLSIINVYNVARLCRSRIIHTKLGLVLTVLLFSGVMFGICTALKSYAIFTAIYAFGSLLLIPLLCVFLKGGFLRISAILCTSMGFTFLALMLSVLIGGFFGKEWLAAAVLAAFVAILAAFAPLYSKFCKQVFDVKSHGCEKNMQIHLAQVSIIWFTSVLFTYYAITTEHPIFLVLSLCGMGGMALSCYNLMHSSAIERGNSTRLSKIIHTDSLTALPNRTAFFRDGQGLIAKRTSFDLVFIDLNSFKSINDRFGHNKGNDYLIGFASALNTLVAKSGRAYRHSGDEFVIVTQCGKGGEMIATLSTFVWKKYIKEIEFLGFSAGCASYPIDAIGIDELIHLADKNMYKNKPSAIKNAVSWI